MDASEFGPACPQPADSGTGTHYGDQSEDCLTLNVWTPSADGERRPVMVWVHGGGWIYEGTEDPLYSGAHLAARGDVVVVSMEYRMGVFGFSHFDEIPGSGNAGLLDQKLALEWVRDHIEAFGGDPNDVTLFGESAGGMSATALMAMPDAQGLFHKVIAQSGAGSTARSVDYATAISEKLMGLAEVDNLSELVGLSMEELRDAQDLLVDDTFISDSLFGSVVDGDIFPKGPIQAIADGSAADIPLMAGTTLDETRLWILYVPILADISFDAIVALLPYGERAIPEGKTAQDVMDLYESNRPGAEDGVITHAAGSDIFFRLPAIRMAEAQLTHQPNNTFLYRFHWPAPAPAVPDEDLGSPHGADLGFMFGSGNEPWLDIYGPDPLPQALTEQMMDAWLAFAKTGNPNHSNMPEWPAYDPSARATMIFDTTDTATTSEVVNDPDGSERAFWDGVPFDGITPTWAPEDL
jgi:para-nitrobenzyl esterase